MKNMIQTLKNNGVVLMSTDTTFGLGAKAFSQEAYNKLMRIKKRDHDKRFLLLVADQGQLQKLVNVPDLAWDIIDYSDKPTTIIYDDIIDVPEYLLSPNKTIAIRLVEDKNLKKLIHKIGQPLLSTSANISGEATPKNFHEISNEIKSQVDYIEENLEMFKPKYEGSSIIYLSKTNEVKVIRA